MVVAFSGGPDSTALLWSLVRLRETRRVPGFPLVAAHLDHDLDPGSAARAEQARELARRLGLADDEIRSHRLDGTEAHAAADGVEDWARRRRYEFLHRVAEDVGAACVLTAHHADDQAETVALRLLYGSGLRGLSGIHPERPLPSPAPADASGREPVRLVRPLLGVRRREIEDCLRRLRQEDPDLVPLQDPTNLDLGQPRSRLRHHVLPALEEDSPGALDALRRVAPAAARFRHRLDERLRDLLCHSAPPPPTSRYQAFETPRRTVHLDAFLRLPAELRHHALDLLHRSLGASRPPSESAVAELERQLRSVRGTEDGLGVDCGDALRWRVVGSPDGTAWLLVERAEPLEAFTYTFRAPGAVHVPEFFFSLHLRTHAAPPREAPRWMYRGEVLRTGLALPDGMTPTVVVRTRRAGDRLHPLGSPGRQKLKHLLIDRKVPRGVRDRLPLLFLDGILAWVPGVTIHEGFRLPRPADPAADPEVDEPATSRPRTRLWVAEIRPGPTPPRASLETSSL